MGQPQKKVVKFRYVDTISMNIGSAGGATSHIFRANGMYHPDVTGTGHQPRGFDQWSTFYTQYCVIASKIRVTFSTASAHGDTANHPVLCVLQLNDDTSVAGGDITSAKENNYTKSTILDVQEKNKGVLTMGFSNKRIGISHPLSDDTCKALFSADPASLAYYVLMAEDMHATASAIGDITCHVEIDYTAVLLEPKDIVSS